MRITAEQLEAFRPGMRAELPARVRASLIAEGLEVDRDPRTGDLVAADGTRLSFQADGLPRAITRPSGLAYGFEHDREGRLAGLIHPGGERLEIDRDARGDLAALRRPGLLGYRLEHDAGGQLVGVEYPDGTEISITYQAPEKPSSVTDRAGAITRYAWDDAGRLRAIVDPLGRRTGFEVDEGGALTAIHFPDGTRQEHRVDPAVGLRVTLRDGGQLVQEIGGEAIEAIAWPDGSRTDFELDGGKLVRATSAWGSIAHGFDDAGRPLTEETPHGLVRYAYDAAGRLTELVAPGAEAIGYGYDEDGRVRVIRAWDGAEARLTYASDGTVAEIAYGNGVVEKQRYARVGRLATAYLLGRDGKRLSEQAYEYDTCERLTAVTDIWGDGPYDRRARRLGYDGESRLVSETDAASGTPIARWGHDAKGNLIDDAGVPVRVGRMDEPIERGGQAIEYDGLGRVLRMPGRQGEIACAWNGDGTLREARLGDRTWRYAYDALGRRVSKTDGHTIWRYGWAQHQLLWEEVQDGPTAEPVRRDYLYLPDSFTPLAFREGGRTYWLQVDARGAVIRALDAAGRIVWRASYDAFGAARAEVAEIRQPFRLAGQYEDEETGLHYNFARYYCPRLKSYLSLDPSFLDDGATHYSYARNDPWNRVDPFGTIAPLLLAVGAVAVGGLVGGIVSKCTGGSFWGGFASGAITTTGAIVGGLLGGPAGVIAGGIIGGAVGAIAESVIDNLLKGEAICWPCAFKAAALSTAIDLLLLGLSKIPFVKALAKKAAEALKKWAAPILEKLGPILEKRLGRFKPAPRIDPNKDAAAKRLAKHKTDVAAHKAKYERELAKAEQAGASKQVQGGHKAKITEAKGELAAAEHMEKKYPDLQMERGFQPGTGFDQVYVKRGPDGKVTEYVIVEAKGPGAELSTNAAKGKQMSKDWVGNTADEMARSKNVETQQLGRDIRRALDTGDPPVTGKVIQATQAGGAVELPATKIPDSGIYN